MQQICQESIDNRHHDTLGQILLKFAYFFELKQSLTYVLQGPIQKQFKNLIENVQYQMLVRKEPLALEQGFVYFFLERGAICRREGVGRTQKTIMSRDKTCLTLNQKFNRSHQSKQPPKMYIQEFNSYEEIQTVNKYVQNFYYYFNAKSTTVLYLHLSQLKQSIQQKIKDLNLSKLKFLVSLAEMRVVERMAVAERIHKFQYLQIQFGQVLYGRGVRPGMVFFLKNGSVQLISGRKKSSGFVINYKALLGLSKGQGEWVKCASEKIECYAMKHEDLQFWYPGLGQVASRQVNRLRIFQETAIVTPQHRFQQDTGCMTPISIGTPDTSHAQTGKISFNRRRFMHKSMEDLKGGQKKKSRQLALRQHFSNYYNQKFDQFSEKKVKKMGNTLDPQENLNLYEIKILQRKQPAMDELKKKLKRIRIQKIKACKQKLRRKVHIQCLNGTGVTVMQEYY